MATINRADLLDDTKLWLPDTSTLSDTQISFINERVITVIGDNDNKYGEVLCKSLLAAAQANKALFKTNDGGLIRERTASVELYYDAKISYQGWDEYIRNLPDICTLFGYELPTVVGMVISPGDVTKPTDECDTDELYL